jgi:hypothetical protein
VVAAAAAGEQPDNAPQADAVHNTQEQAEPSLPDSLLDAVTFRLTFDHRSLEPDMAAGDESAPVVLKAHLESIPEPEFEPGVRGNALVLGTGAGLYPRNGNVTLERRGAIALWVKPLEWKRPNGGNVVFLMTSAARFYLQRQGPLQDENGNVRRHETIQFLAKTSAEDKRFSALGAQTWPNGTWHFLVACWDWPAMWLSVDGNPFSATSAPKTPPETLFGNLIVGARSGDRALLDEVWAFNRPLKLDEVKSMQARFAPPE